MTAIMVAGDIPSTGVIREAKAGRVTLADGAAAAAALTDHLGRALSGRGAVLVLYPSWRPDPVERLIRLARGVLHTDRVAGVGLDLPPLAISLLADQLAYLSRRIAPGVLAGLARRLSAELVTGAWVNSVARLEHVNAGVGAHLASYLPGSAFMVTAGARAGVHRITTSRPVADVTPHPRAPVVVLAAQGDGDATWLHGSFRPVLSAAAVTSVGTQPLSADYWGTRKYVEFVAFSGHPSALRRAVQATRGQPCAWCGEATALAVCAFCSMVQPTPRARPARSRPARPATPEPQPARPR